MKGKTYTCEVIFVKLDPEVEELKTQKILKIVANALARQAAATANASEGGAREGKGALTARRGEVTRSGAKSAVIDKGKVKAA
jgi:hypothetical protein